MDLLDVLPKKVEYPPDLKWYTYDEIMAHTGWAITKAKTEMHKKYKAGLVFRETKIVSGKQTAIYAFKQKGQQ